MADILAIRAWDGNGRQHNFADRLGVGGDGSNRVCPQMLLDWLHETKAVRVRIAATAVGPKRRPAVRIMSHEIGPELEYADVAGWILDAEGD